MTEFAPGLHAALGKDVDISAYDRFAGRWSRLFIPDVIAAAEIDAGSRVLDICTGTGEAAIAALPVIGPSGILVGADISPEMVTSARKRVNHTGFLLVVTDGQALAFRDDCFDAVICSSVCNSSRIRHKASPSSTACYVLAGRRRDFNRRSGTDSWTVGRDIGTLLAGKAPYLYVVVLTQ